MKELFNLFNPLALILEEGTIPAKIIGCPLILTVHYGALFAIAYVVGWGFKLGSS